MKINIQLTKPELKQLIMVLEDKEEEGSWYGNHDQYWNRHNSIKKQLEFRLKILES